VFDSRVNLLKVGVTIFACFCSSSYSHHSRLSYFRISPEIELFVRGVLHDLGVKNADFVLIEQLCDSWHVDYDPNDALEVKCDEKNEDSLACIGLSSGFEKLTDGQKRFLVVRKLLFCFPRSLLTKVPPNVSFATPRLSLPARAKVNGGPLALLAASAACLVGSLLLIKEPCRFESSLLRGEAGAFLSSIGFITGMICVVGAMGWLENIGDGVLAKELDVEAARVAGDADAALSLIEARIKTFNGTPHPLTTLCVECLHALAQEQAKKSVSSELSVS